MFYLSIFFDTNYFIQNIFDLFLDYLKVSEGNLLKDFYFGNWDTETLFLQNMCT